MTPEHTQYRFEPTGEVRHAKNGEMFLNHDGHIVPWHNGPCTVGIYPIYRRVPHDPDTAAEQPITPAALEALGFSLHNNRVYELNAGGVWVCYWIKGGIVEVNGGMTHITTIGSLKMLITALTKGSV